MSTKVYKMGDKKSTNFYVCFCAKSRKCKLMLTISHAYDIL